MVRGEEVVATADEEMGEAEGGRGRRWVRQRSASGGRGRPWTTASTTPSRGGNRSSTSPGAWKIRPGGPQGKERTTVGGGERATIGGGGWSLSALNGRDDAADATPLAPPLLLLSSLSSSAIAEEDVAGGVPVSVDANLDAVPANKEDIVNTDNDGATAAAVIAMPDTTGGDDVREAIVLALSSSTRRALIVISLVMDTFFSSFYDVDLPHSMLVDCCMICCQECGPIAIV